MKKLIERHEKDLDFFDDSYTLESLTKNIKDQIEDVNFTYDKYKIIYFQDYDYQALRVHYYVYESDIEYETRIKSEAITKEKELKARREKYERLLKELKEMEKQGI